MLLIFVYPKGHVLVRTRELLGESSLAPCIALPQFKLIEYFT